MAHRTRFDQAYFDRWYRDPHRRVLDRAEIARRAALVVSIAEYVLERPQTLDALPLRGLFDVVIASGVLNFLSDATLRRAARTIARLTNGVAFLELFTASDEVLGDTRGWRPRSAAYYRRVLRAAGLVQCGPHCYSGPSRTSALAALER